MNDKELIKSWRRVNGFGQAEAAKILGYASYQSISYFETGRRKVPNQTKHLIKYQMMAKNLEKQNG